MSKIMFAGDCHGATGIQTAINYATFRRSEALVLCGDVWDVNRNYENPNGIPVSFVRGNHEDIHKLRHSKLDYIADYETRTIEDVLVGGIGGIDGISHLGIKRTKPFLYNSVYRSKQPSVEFIPRSMSDIPFQNIDILVTHDAPWPIAIGPEITGSQYLTSVVKHFRPKVALHGHFHWYDVRQIYSTTIIGLDEVEHMADINSFHEIDTETL